MKAIRVHQFGPPDVMKLEDIPVPAPGPSRMLVRVKAAGVNPVDTYIRSGQAAPNLPLPYTPGIDGAGVVEAVGPNVTRHRVGDRVYFSDRGAGGHAEIACVAETLAWPLPDDASFEMGAALGIPYATAWRALFQRGRAVRGETVLIHGASGAVGLAATQIAHAAGLRVIGTAGTDAGLDLVRAQGADVVLSHREASHLEAILAATQGRGVDIVLEMLANVNLAADLTVLANRGRIVVIGSRGAIEINPREAMKRDADILGMLLFNATTAELDEVHAALFRGLTDGSLRPIISRRYPLADAAQAHRDVMETNTLGKLILRP